MLIYVVNKTSDIIGLIEDTNSVIWNNRYVECGDFELCAPATGEYIALLQRDNILVRDGHWTNGMIIEDVEITTDEENGDTITVTGRCLKSIVARRIIWQQTNIRGNVEGCVWKLLDDAIMNPSIPERRISNFVFLKNGGITDTMSNQYTGKNLYEIIVQICKKYGLGYDVLLDLENKRFIFHMYKGTDRSYDQEDNPYVVFSNDFENLLTTTFIESAQNFKNVAKIAGEGEGIDRKFAVVGNATGLDRYELYIDARDSSTNNGEISDADYLQMLRDEATETLTEYEVIRSYDGEVETGVNYVYGEDYFMGDLVEVVNEYGMAASARIIEVIDSEDATGRHTYPTFSAWI